MMDTVKLKNLYRKDTLIALVIAIICTYLLFPSLFVLQLGPLSPENYFAGGLDLSWAVTLNYAIKNELIWGNDIVYTHGPLSFLAIRVGWGISKYAFLLYDLFYLSNIFIICYLTYKQSINKFLSVVIILSVSLTASPNPGGAHALILLFFLIFWIRRNFKRRQHINYIIQVVLIVLLFYIKFNTVFISLIFYYTSLLYLLFYKKEKILWPLMYGILPVISIIALSFTLNVDVVNYITTGFEFVAGYNEIMYLTDPRLNYMLWLVIVFALLTVIFFGVKLYTEKEFLITNLMVFFLFSASLFVLYKQAFLRGDIWHITEFFKFSPLLLLCSSCFTDYQFKKKISYIVIAMLGILVLPSFTSTEVDVFSFCTRFNKSQYYDQFKNFEPKEGMYLIPAVSPLPENITKKIGKSTTDVYPTNSYMLYENNINYLPRPTLQAYAAYTESLGKLDFDHYNSGKGPQFLLYDYEGIDYRYPLFDSAKMHLVLQKNYTVKDTFSFNGHKLILLEKKKNVKPVKLKFIREYAMYSSSPLIPKKDIYYEVNFYTTFKSKINSVFNHAPMINLGIHTMDGVVSEYRTSRALLESGLFSTIKISNAHELQQLIDKENVGKERIIKQYFFIPAGSGDFKDKIRIKEYQIN